MKFTIEHAVMFLGLKKPFNIRMVSKSRKKYAAAHWEMINTKTGKLKSHEIVVHLNLVDSPRDLDTLLAHEFIHAWQAENPKSVIKKKKHHGEEFILMAKEMGDLFDLPDIYIPELDTR